MRKGILSAFIFLSIIMEVKAQQQQSGVQHNDNTARTTFTMPTQAIIVSEDSSKMKMYASDVDSSLGMQVTIIDSAYLDVQDTLMTNVLAMNSNDTLRAFAQILLLVTNGNLTSIADITDVSGTQFGLEVGIEYNELIEDVPTLTFIRYFLIDHRFISYIISGSSDDVMRLTTYKDSFFNSINFY